MTDPRDVRALAERIAKRIEVGRLTGQESLAVGLDELTLLLAADTRATEAERQLASLRVAINAYRAGIMALNPALSAALFAHLPEPKGGDSEF